MQRTAQFPEMAAQLPHQVRRPTQQIGLAVEIPLSVEFWSGCLGIQHVDGPSHLINNCLQEQRGDRYESRPLLTLTSRARQWMLGCDSRRSWPTRLSGLRT